MDITVEAIEALRVPEAHATPYQGYGCGLHAFMEVEEALRYYDLTTMRR